MRKLLAHEAHIVAINDISRQPDVPEMGLTSERLAQHSLTKDISERDMGWAVGRARDAGWLMGDDLFGQSLDGNWHGLRLTHDGLAKVADLTRPWWRTALAALGGDVRTVIVGAISGGIGGVIAGVVIVLLD